MSGLIGKKIGMTSLFDTDGSLVGCTVIEAGPYVVTHVKTMEKDGYRRCSSPTVSAVRRTAPRPPKATTRRRTPPPR